MPDTAAPSPIPVMVRRYRCPACNRSLSRRAAIVEHIARCWHLPANRGCKTCRHFEPDRDACGCEPGCQWGGEPVPEQCTAGVDITGGPIVHCERWEPKDAA